MVVNQKKLLQYLRGNVVATKQLAIDGLKALTFPSGVDFDGTPVVARYTEGEGVKSIYAIYHNTNGKQGVTIFDSVEDLSTVLSRITTNENNIKTLSARTTTVTGPTTGHVTVASAATAEGATTYTISATDIASESALTELQETVKGDRVKSTGKTINVVSGADGTEISVNIDNASIVADANGKLSVASSAITVNGSQAISAATGANGTTVSLVIDNDKVLTQSANGLKTNLQFEYNSTDKKIYLYGSAKDADHEIGHVDCADFLVDGMLDSVAWSTESGKEKHLIFTFNTASGPKTAIDVDMTKLVDVYTVATSSANYLNITDYTVSAKTVALAEASDTKTGIADAKDTKDYIDGKIGTASDGTYIATANTVNQNLKALDTQVKANTDAIGTTSAGTIVSASTDATVGQNLNALDAAVANALTEVKINGLVKGTEGKPGDYSIENGVETIILDGNDIYLGGNGTGWTASQYPDPFSALTGVENILISEDGKSPSVTEAINIVEKALNALVGVVLDNEEVTEKAFEAFQTATGLGDAEGKIVYVQNTGATYISGATSLNDADVKLDAAIKALDAKQVVVKHDKDNEHVTVSTGVTVDNITTYTISETYDFGLFEMPTSNE